MRCCLEEQPERVTWRRQRLHCRFGVGLRRPTGTLRCGFHPWTPSSTGTGEGLCVVENRGTGTVLRFAVLYLDSQCFNPLCTGVLTVSTPRGKYHARRISWNGSRCNWRWRVGPIRCCAVLCAVTELSGIVAAAGPNLPGDRGSRVRASFSCGCSRRLVPA